MKLTHPRRKGCLLERGNCFVFLAANCFAKIKPTSVSYFVSFINVEEMFALDGTLTVTNRPNDVTRLDAREECWS